MKKKRSAKQLANDKRLGRAAKKRAALRRKTNPKKKKVRKKRKKIVRKKRNVRKKNPRKSLKKSHLWRIFRCKGKSVMWLLMNSGGKWSWTSDAGKAILFATKNGAATVARGISKKRGYASYQLGVAPREMSGAQVAADCSK